MLWGFFVGTLLDRDYIGNSARETESGREIEREQGNRIRETGHWPTLNGNSNSASISEKKEMKRIR